MTAVDTVQQLTLNLLPAREHLPPVVWGLFQPLHIIRKTWHCWRVYHQVDFLINDASFCSIIAGAKIGNSIPVRCFAYLCLLSNRVHMCQDLAEDLSDTYRQLIDAIKGKYESPRESTWIQGQGSSPFSATFINSRQMRALIDRAKRIIICIFHLIKEIFLLSMYLLDTLDAFFINPLDPTHDVRINELFRNFHYSIDHLVKDQELLLCSMNKNKVFIEKILTVLHSPIHFEDITTILDGALTVTRVVKKGNDVFGDFLSVWKYNALTGLASSLQFNELSQFVSYPTTPTNPREYFLKTLYA